MRRGVCPAFRLLVPVFALPFGLIVALLIELTAAYSTDVGKARAVVAEVVYDLE